MEPLHPDDPRELGRFRLLRRVGEGGMGVVFLAVSTEGAADGTGSATGDDLAAVKAIRPEFSGDREFRARFASEVELARRVRGPYTARVLDADTEGRKPWLATEYVPGPSLHQAVRDSGPFPEPSLLALAAGLAEALNAIHGVGLVHRDLKPSNVLLSPRGPQVIDFGIARATDATALTRTGQALGTPAYMSPEQAVGSVVDPRSDLFSFGGVLLFTATGRQPFGTGNAHALLYRVVNEEPDLTGVPEGLRPLITACLAKNPDDRPELASVLADLTGTKLPRGGEDPTEWLPEAVATKVLHTTAAATEVAPTLAVTSEVPAEELAEEPVQEETAPEDAAPEEPSAPAELADEAPSEASPSETDRAPDQAPRSRDPEASSSRALWFLGTATVAMVTALALVINATGGIAPQAGAGDNSQASESNQPAPFAPELDEAEARGREVADSVFLDGADRFATLSGTGVNIFEAGKTSAVEQVTDSYEVSLSSSTELVTTLDGSLVAARSNKTTLHGAAIHVWDLESSERHVIELPDAGGGGYLALSPDGETVYFGENVEEEPTVSAYRVSDGEELYSVEVPAEPRTDDSTDTSRRASIVAVGTAQGGDLLVAALDTGIAVWDAATGEPHPSHPELREWRADFASTAAIGDRYVAAAAPLGVLLWDLTSDEDPKAIPLPEELMDTDARSASTGLRVQNVALGNSETRITASGQNRSPSRSFLITWDLEGEVLAEGDPRQEYTSLTASPDDNRVLVSTYALNKKRDQIMILGGNLEPVETFHVPRR